MSSLHQEHNRAVRGVSAAIAKFYVQNQKYRIFHGSSNSTRPPHSGNYVDISDLNHILEVDKKSMTATVEPNVSMDGIVKATLAHGLIPPVVMEFPGITIGGSFAGSSGESSSWKYSSLDKMVEEIEVVLGNGDVVNASSKENSDLFNGIGGALGTLGVVTKLKITLIPAKRYVRLAYHHYDSIESTVAAIKEATKSQKNDYIDGIMCARDHGLVMIGQGTNDVPLNTRIKIFSQPWDEWFYIHAQKQPCNEIAIDYIPLAEYLFRWDRGSFWMGTYALQYWGFVPFNRITRTVFDDFLHTRPLYKSLQQTNSSNLTIIQDVSFPYDTVGDFMHYVSDEFNIFPMWLCPLPAVPGPTFHPHTADEKGQPLPMLNVGVWGMGPRDINECAQRNRDMEMKMLELRGRKVLYAHAYYTEEEFWKIYGKEWYDKLREKYQAKSLPTVYEKVKVNVAAFNEGSFVTRLRMQWPVTGILGIAYAAMSRDIWAHRFNRISTWTIPDQELIS